jgi:hypothetical protein
MPDIFDQIHAAASTGATTSTPSPDIFDDVATDPLAIGNRNGIVATNARKFLNSGRPTRKPVRGAKPDVEFDLGPTSKSADLAGGMAGGLVDVFGGLVAGVPEAALNLVTGPPRALYNGITKGSFKAAVDTPPTTRAGSELIDRTSRGVSRMVRAAATGDDAAADPFTETVGRTIPAAAAVLETPVRAAVRGARPAVTAATRAVRNAPADVATLGQTPEQLINRTIGPDAIHPELDLNVGRGVSRGQITGNSAQELHAGVREALPAAKQVKQRVLARPEAHDAAIDGYALHQDLFGDHPIGVPESKWLEVGDDLKTRVTQMSGGTGKLTAHQAEQLKNSFPVDFNRIAADMTEGAKNTVMLKGRRAFDRAIDKQVPGYEDINRHLADLHYADDVLRGVVRHAETTPTALEQPVSNTLGRVARPVRSLLHGAATNEMPASGLRTGAVSLGQRTRIAARRARPVDVGDPTTLPMIGGHEPTLSTIPDDPAANAIGNGNGDRTIATVPQFAGHTDAPPLQLQEPSSALGELQDRTMAKTFNARRPQRKMIEPSKPSGPVVYNNRPIGTKSEMPQRSGIDELVRQAAEGQKKATPRANTAEGRFATGEVPLPARRDVAKPVRGNAVSTPTATNLPYRPRSSFGPHGDATADARFTEYQLERQRRAIAAAESNATSSTPKPKG